MTPASDHVAATLRAAAEVFVPGPPSDATYGAADFSAEHFIAHYLDVVMPGLADGIPDLLDTTARASFGLPFVDLTLEQREAVLDAVAEHPVEQLQQIPQLLALLAIGAMYGEWTGYDDEGDLTHVPFGWSATGFDGPSRGRAHLLQ